jgi:hypothetical protein
MRDKDWAEACRVAAELVVSSGGDIPLRWAVKEAIRLGQHPVQ